MFFFTMRGKYDSSVKRSIELDQNNGIDMETRVEKIREGNIPIFSLPLSKMCLHLGYCLCISHYVEVNIGV